MTEKKKKKKGPTSQHGSTIFGRKAKNSTGQSSLGQKFNWLPLAEREKLIGLTAVRRQCNWLGNVSQKRAVGAGVMEGGRRGAIWVSANR